tara:strand:- start:674 stop:1318 length:645 start_codon:yes stop_codon:yes gene_type:complete
MSGFLRKENSPGFLKSKHSFLRNKYKVVGYTCSFHVGSELQDKITALKKEGCTSIFHEGIDSTGQLDYKQKFKLVLESLRKEDRLIVTSLLDLGSTQLEVISNLNIIEDKGAYLKVLDLSLDTKTLGEAASMIFGFLGGIMSLEKGLIPEKETKRIETKLSKINLGGRPKTNPKKESLVIKLRNQGFSYRSIREQTGLALTTIRRIIIDNSKAA